MKISNNELAMPTDDWVQIDQHFHVSLDVGFDHFRCLTKFDFFFLSFFPVIFDLHLYIALYSATAAQLGSSQPASIVIKQTNHSSVEHQHDGPCLG